MSTQLVGTSGTYFVMAALTSKGLQASCTFGNAPFVDVLVSSKDGSKSIAVQVKTASWAMRTRGRGKNKVPHHLEFPLGYRSAKICHDGLFFAFVDLKNFSELPDVYIVSSSFVSKYCKDWVDDTKWVRLHIEIAKIAPYKNNWKLIENALL